MAKGLMMMRMAAAGNWDDRLKTGFFGIPGRVGGQVHIVNADTGKPICSQPIHPDAEFQWCAAGANFEYVECKRCSQRAEARFTAALNRVRRLNAVRFRHGR